MGPWVNQLYTHDIPIQTQWFAKVLLADAFGDLAHVEVGRFGTAVHQRFSKEKPGAVAVARQITGWFK